MLTNNHSNWSTVIWIFLAVGVTFMVAHRAAHSNPNRYMVVPPGTMKIMRDRATVFHAKYTYCAGVLDAYAYFAKKADHKEMMDETLLFSTYFLKKAFKKRQEMLSDHLFSGKVDLILFDIASHVVYKDGQEYVVEQGPMKAIFKLKSCIDMIQPDQESKDEQDRDSGGNRRQDYRHEGIASQQLGRPRR